MSPELKERWLADLRSGKYPKTRNFLKDDKGYCCLGVLVETTGHKFETKEIPKTGRTGHYYLPPPKVGISQVLLTKFEEKVGLNGHATNLTWINDDHATFDEVCEYIEKNL